jgi:GTP-binding protein Era
MKRGIVCLVGRPNVGKSTLLNNILGHKVSITSPKPQTTRFAIQAVYEDNRGQIVFLDTPGIFGKAEDLMSKRINQNAEEALGTQIDLVIYIIDHTRSRDFEENKTLGIVRKMNAPKILVINKIDVKHPTHIEEYLFMKDEFDEVVEISALKRLNLNILLETIFDRLQEGEPLVDTSTLVQPGINLDSKTFIAEIIREKAYLNLRKEIP